MSTAPATLRKTTAKRDQAAAEYRQATDNLKFSKDFNTSLEAIMRDPLSTWGERFTAWLKRYSWGEYSLYAIDAEGNPRTLADAAKELAGEKVAHSPYKVASVRSRLSHTAKYMEARNYLRREGKKLYPVISPQAASPTRKSCDSRNFSQFLEHYKVAHSDTFSELEVARSRVKTLQKSILSEYKKWRESQLLEGASLLTKTKEKKKERAGGRSVAVVTNTPAPVPDPPSARPPASPLSTNQAQTPKPNPSPSEEKQPVSPLPEAGAPMAETAAVNGNGSPRPEWYDSLETWLNEQGRIGTLVDPVMLKKIAVSLRRPDLLAEFYREALKIDNPRKYAVYETVARQVYARSLTGVKHELTYAELREITDAQARQTLADPNAPAYRVKMAKDLLGIREEPKPRKVRYIDPDTGELVVLDQSVK